MNRTWLIHKILSGKANDEEIKEIEAWIEKDVGNKLEFEDIKLLWEYSNKPDDEKDLNTSDFDDGLLKIERAIALLKRKKGRGEILTLIGIITAIFLLVIAVYIFLSRAE